jgi:hypothetical protein
MAGKRRPIIASSRESRLSVVFMVMFSVFFLVVSIFVFSLRLAGMCSGWSNYHLDGQLAVSLLRRESVLAFCFAGCPKNIPLLTDL